MYYCFLWICSAANFGIKQLELELEALTLMSPHSASYWQLTHWGREKLICVGKLTIIASDNGLSPIRRQAIIWINAGILLIIRPLGTNFSEILIEIHTFSFKKMHLKMSSAKRRPFCLGLNELTDDGHHWQQEAINEGSWADGCPHPTTNFLSGR